MDNVTVVDPLHFLLLFMVCCFVATLLMLGAFGIVAVAFVAHARMREHVAAADHHRAQQQLDEETFKMMSATPPQRTRHVPPPAASPTTETETVPKENDDGC